MNNKEKQAKVIEKEIDDLYQAALKAGVVEVDERYTFLLENTPKPRRVSGPTTPTINLSPFPSLFLKAAQAKSA